jgi:1,4-dihydroxy-2-naphthoyl-CoA hydrolase
MSIWTVPTDIDEINNRCRGSLCEHLGIKITEITERTMTASMPVDGRTNQPMGILHGGASAALAETVGSVAANYCLQPGQVAVGLDLNINHIRQANQGHVKAVAQPLHLGKTTHVWEIKIYNEEGKIIAASRLTMAILVNKNPSNSRSY